MSEVISFRTNKDNPREAQAIEVLKTWVDQGYSVRHVLAEALLAYHGPQRNVEIDEITIKLDQISNMLQQNGTPSKHKGSNNMGIFAYPPKKV